METKSLDDIIKPSSQLKPEPLFDDPQYEATVRDVVKQSQDRQAHDGKWGYRLPKKPSTPEHRPPYWMRAKNPENQKYVDMPWGTVLTNAVANLPANTNTLLGDMFKGLYQIGAGLAVAGWGFQTGKDVSKIHQELTEKYPALPGLASIIGGGVYKASHIDYAFRAVRALADDGNVTTEDVLEAMKEPVVQTVLFDTMLKIYQDNWGLGPDGITGLKRYVAENPADFLGDIATVATLGASGAANAAKLGKLAIRSKHLRKFKFNDFYDRHLARHARGTRWEHGLRRSADQVQDFYTNLPQNLDKFSAKAKFIGTGVADGNYPPGFWAQLAHYALTYIDVGAAPFMVPGLLMGRLNILGTGALSKVAPEDPRVEQLATELFREFHADEFGKPRKTRYTFDETSRIGLAVLGYDTYNARVPIEYLKVGPDEFRAFVYTGDDIDSLDEHMRALDKHREATRDWRVEMSRKDYRPDRVFDREWVAENYARGEREIREKVPEESHEVLKNHFTPIEDLRDDELLELGIQRLDTKNALDQFLSNIIPEEYLPYPDRPNPAIVRHQQLLEAIRLTEKNMQQRLRKAQSGKEMQDTAVQLSQEVGESLTKKFDDKYYGFGLKYTPLHSGLVNTVAVLRDALEKQDPDFVIFADFSRWDPRYPGLRGDPDVDETVLLEDLRSGTYEDDWRNIISEFPAQQDARAQQLLDHAKVRDELRTFFDQVARGGISEDAFKTELKRLVESYQSITAMQQGPTDIEALLKFRDSLSRYAANKKLISNKFFLRLTHALNMDYFRNIRESVTKGSGQHSYVLGKLLFGEQIGEKGLHDSLNNYLGNYRHYNLDTDGIVDLYASRYYEPWISGEIDSEFLDEVYGLSRHDVEATIDDAIEGRAEVRAYYEERLEEAKSAPAGPDRAEDIARAEKDLRNLTEREKDYSRSIEEGRESLENPNLLEEKTSAFLEDLDAFERAYFQAQENIEDLYTNAIIDAINQIDSTEGKTSVIIDTLLRSDIDPSVVMERLDEASADKVRNLIFDQIISAGRLSPDDFYYNEIYWRVANINEPHENFFTHLGEDIELGRIFTALDLVQNPKLDDDLRRMLLEDLDERLEDYAEKGFIRDPDVPDDYFDLDGEYIDDADWEDGDFWDNDVDVDDDDLDNFFSTPDDPNSTIGPVERKPITDEFKQHLLKLAKEEKWDELSEIFGQPADTVKIEIVDNIDPNLKGFRHIQTHRYGKYSVKSYEEAHSVVEGGNFVPPVKDPFVDKDQRVDVEGRDPYNRQVLTLFSGEETGGSGNPYWRYHFTHNLGMPEASEVIARPNEFINYYDKDKWFTAQEGDRTVPWVPNDSILSNVNRFNQDRRLEKIFGAAFTEQLQKLGDLSENYPKMTREHYENAHRFIRDSLTNGTPAFLVIQGLVDSQNFINHGDRYLDTLDIIFKTVGPAHTSTFLGSAAAIELVLQGLPESQRGQVRQWLAEYRRASGRVARSQEEEERQNRTSP